MISNFILCPVCGKHKFPSWEDNGTCICPECGWAHNQLGETEPLEVYGPNDLSLNNYKLRYQYYTEHYPQYYYLQDKYPEIQQIEPLLCPVCGKYMFEKLTWDDIYCGITPSDISCPQCGWHYDEKQHHSPDLECSANVLSLNHYKKTYEEKLKLNPDYVFFDEETEKYIPVPHKCPVCGLYEFKDVFSYEICPNCGWEDDGSEDNSIIGANEVLFSEFQKKYKSQKSADSKYKWANEIKK